MMERSVYLTVAVLQVLAFGPILCKIDVKLKKRDLSQDDFTVRRLFNLGKGFLADEFTPVWYADGSTDDSGIVYYIRHFYHRGMIKAAIEQWEEMKFNARGRRSIDESASDMIVKNLKNWNNETLPTSSGKKVNKKSLEKRETMNNNVHHLSILIVMYYSTLTFPDGSSPFNTILYALAFWNSVHLQLRHVNVRLRIVGIIIARDDKAVPYLKRNVNFQNLLRMENAFHSMMNYWRNEKRNNEHFRDISFDMVATMTDYQARNKMLGVFSDEPPCFGPHIAGHLIQDNLLFGGIQLAVHGIAKILGAKINSDCPAVEQNNIMPSDIGIVGRTWSECTLKQISSNLRSKGSCLVIGESNEINSSDKPAKVILPGDLISEEDICLRWSMPVSRKWTTCLKLYCVSVGVLWNSHELVSRTLDGTKCDEGKICLDEKCVSSQILYNRTV